MRNIAFAVIATLSLHPLYGDVVPPSDRRDIRGGSPALHAEFPFVVRVTSWSGSCGGVLIRPEWAVTAGHCLENETDPGDLRVSRGGVTAPEIRLVGAVYMHPRYANTSLGPVGDLALIRLYRPFSDLAMRTVRMASQTLAGYAVPGSALVVVGDAGIEEDLRYREVELDECPDEVPPDSLLLCMSSPGTPLAQAGDSGGPALLRADLTNATQQESSRYVLMGIASAGATIDGTGWARYTPVHPHREWIGSVLASHLPAAGTEPRAVAACEAVQLEPFPRIVADLSPDLHLRVPRVCVAMGDDTGFGALLEYAPDPGSALLDFWWFGDRYLPSETLLGFKATLPDGSVWHARQIESRGNYRWTSQRLADDADSPYDPAKDNVWNCVPGPTWHECLSGRGGESYAYQDLRSRPDLVCDPASGVE